MLVDERSEEQTIMPTRKYDQTLTDCIMLEELVRYQASDCRALHPTF